MQTINRIARLGFLLTVLSIWDTALSNSYHHINEWAALHLLIIGSQWLRPFLHCFFSAEEMLRTKDYFKNGQLDKEGLVKFIKDVKKNTKLSDEDAAVLAASKFVFHLFSWLDYLH